MKQEAKSKGEKERYTHLKAEFQRIATRDKKTFLSDQCKEIEENNRMGKTRDLVKKIRDTKVIPGFIMDLYIPFVIYLSPVEFPCSRWLSKTPTQRAEVVQSS